MSADVHFDEALLGAIDGAVDGTEGTASVGDACPEGGGSDGGVDTGGAAPPQPPPTGANVSARQEVAPAGGDVAAPAVAVAPMVEELWSELFGPGASRRWSTLGALAIMAAGTSGGGGSGSGALAQADANVFVVL